MGARLLGPPLPSTAHPAVAGPLPAGLPDGPALLAMERRSRREGTGLQPADLIGRWRLDQVWSKGSHRPSSISSALLRSLAARLQIAPGEPAGALRLVNSVNLGLLELSFEGEAQLRGGRPLLVFQFDHLRLLLAGRVVLERPLARPDPRRLPFFALIASARPGETGSEAGWLAARGRSGGLALWRRES
jgi:hypothetical protein